MMVKKNKAKFDFAPLKDFLKDENNVLLLLFTTKGNAKAKLIATVTKTPTKEIKAKNHCHAAVFSVAFMNEGDDNHTVIFLSDSIAGFVNTFNPSPRKSVTSGKNFVEIKNEKRIPNTIKK